MTQEIVRKSQGELSSSDRTGQPVKEEGKRVLKSHDRTGEPVEGRLHKVQENGYLRNQHLRCAKCDGETIAKHKRS